MVEEKLIRTFICIEFNDDVIKEIARVQEELGKVRFTGKLTEVENLHLTLKFIGEIDEEKVEKIRKRLKEVKFKEMTLKLGKIGVFSSWGKPRIVWIKVEGEEIWDLQRKIDIELEKEGLKKEERFMSHLTIARIKYADNKKEFRERVENIGVKEIKFKVDKFKLRKSELRKLGPVYTTIEEYKA